MSPVLFEFLNLANLIIYVILLEVFQLEEKDTQTKLETLFRKNMYDMAIR